MNTEMVATDLGNALEAAGIRGRVEVSIDYEGHYLWARWDSPTDLHMLARANLEDVKGRDFSAYVRGFVNLCQLGALQRHLDGSIPVNKWEPAP